MKVGKESRNFDCVLDLPENCYLPEIGCCVPIGLHFAASAQRQITMPYILNNDKTKPVESNLATMIQPKLSRRASLMYVDEYVVAAAARAPLKDPVDVPVA